MIAFYSNGKTQVKAYFHGDDWQLVSDNKEQWFSTWQHDKRASLHRAFIAFVGHGISANEIHGLKDIKA